MIIYGTALLAFYHLLGIVLGDLLGAALGVRTDKGDFANVGGVGIAMLLLRWFRTGDVAVIERGYFRIMGHQSGNFRAMRWGR